MITWRDEVCRIVLRRRWVFSPDAAFQRICQSPGIAARLLLGRRLPAERLKVIAEAVMPDVFVTTDAAAISLTTEIAAMGPKGHAVALGRLFEVLMAIQAGRVVDEFLTALADSVPVDVLRALEYRHGGINDTVFRLDPEIVQGIVVRQVAVIAGGTKPVLVIAAVDILPIRRGNGFVGMAAGTELVVPRGMKSSVQRCPTRHHANAETCQNTYDFY